MNTRRRRPKEPEKKNIPWSTIGTYAAIPFMIFVLIYLYNHGSENLAEEKAKYEKQETKEKRRGPQKKKRNAGGTTTENMVETKDFNQRRAGVRDPKGEIQEEPLTPEFVREQKQVIMQESQMRIDQARKNLADPKVRSDPDAVRYLEGIIKGMENQQKMMRKVDPDNEDSWEVIYDNYTNPK